MRHTPAAQVAAALAKVHARPQAPQLLASAPRVLTSQPLLGLPSQSERPVMHTPTAQAPPKQAAALTPGSAQALPQAPQWRGSMPVLTQSPRS
jgi:hypothetical protein